MQRVARTYPSCVWLNPTAAAEWDATASIRLMRQIMGGRMYPLTLDGIDAYHAAGMPTQADPTRDDHQSAVGAKSSALAHG